MTENELVVLVRQALLNGLAEVGYGGVAVAGSNQPTTQGKSKDPTIYFSFLHAQREGWQYRKHAPMTGTEENQNVACTYQFMSFAEVDPTNINAPTDADYADAASMVFLSITAIQYLMTHGIGVRRVTEVRHPYFSNEKDQFESYPSFDVTFTFRKTLRRPVVNINQINDSIHPIEG